MNNAGENPMRSIWAMALAAALAVCVTKPWAQAGGTPPLKGVSARGLASLDVGIDLPELAGKAMRMRRIDVEPGGSIGMHSHLGRPAVLYIVEGSIVERRGDAQRTYQAGESYAIGGDTSHAIENPGPKPAVYVEVDIVPAH